LELQLRLPDHQEPPSVLHASDKQAAVMRVLKSLPERYAVALEAKYGDGLSVEDIARQLGLTAIAAQSLLGRAREAFRRGWLSTTADAISGEDWL
jgi:DNA-directed RNA polymerase specialized sigma24 family protein